MRRAALIAPEPSPAIVHVCAACQRPAASTLGERNEYLRQNPECAGAIRDGRHRSTRDLYTVDELRLRAMLGG